MQDPITLTQSLLTVVVLLVNAVAVLSEDRFLARSKYFFQSAGAATVDSILMNNDSWLGQLCSPRTRIRSHARRGPSERQEQVGQSNLEYSDSNEEYVERKSESVFASLTKTAVPLIVVNTLIVSYELVLG